VQYLTFTNQIQSLGYSHFAKTARKDTEQTPKQPWKNYDLVSKKQKHVSMSLKNVFVNSAF